MLKLLVWLLAFTLVSTGAPSPQLERYSLAPRDYPATLTAEGHKDGFYYHWFTDTAPTNFTNGPKGQFSYVWPISTELKF